MPGRVEASGIPVNLDEVGQLVLVDASVAVKWCVPTGEPRADAAAAVLEAHLAGRVVLSVLDLTLYEVGNALAGKGLIGRELEEVLGLLGLWDLGWRSVSTPEDVALTSDLVGRYDLSFYDASYLAVALRDDIPLLTDDQALFEAARSEDVGVHLSG